MSFCLDVKNDLLMIRPPKCCQPSFTYGFMLFGRSFSIKRICLQTANENVANAYCEAVKRVYNITPNLSCGGTKRPTYKAEVISEAERLKILASVDFGVEEDLIDRSFFVRECCVQSFVRGAFLACGNINDPEKEYRAEFNLKNEKSADELYNLLSENGIEMRKIPRSNGYMLYTKDSLVIEDLLTFMGASRKALEIIDTKVEKSVKNNINRARNCDDANISKTVEASIRQRTAIEFLEKTDRLYSLPSELLEVALLRKENPEATLKELCKISKTPISLSGIYHRLNKIIEIYENEL